MLDERRRRPELVPERLRAQPVDQRLLSGARFDRLGADVQVGQTRLAVEGVSYAPRPARDDEDAGGRKSRDG